MISGLVVGIVLDNKDPNQMNRVLVKYPVDSQDELQSSWCRMMTPMTGKLRGMVMLPDIGTEVVLAMAYRTMSAYVIGAVYNGGDDKPEPYHNDDGNDDKRVFWSRNDHMVIFDDTSGAENVSFGAKAATRLDVKSGPIYQILDSSQKTITEYCDKDTIWEAVEKISFKCKDFKVEASMTVAIEGKTAILASDTKTDITSTTTQTYKATKVAVNPAAPCTAPTPALTLPTHKHPPTK